VTVTLARTHNSADVYGALEMTEHYLVGGTLTVSAFCLTYCVGRTFLYREIKAGRLSAIKAGTKTLILRKEAERWASSLPKLGAANERA
jgi:hypothetical protein